MTSNVFVLPRSVDTLNTGRIKTNKSSTAILWHFYSTSEPTSSSVTLENQSGLLEGMIWSRKYSDNIPTSLYMYDGSTFTREGIYRTDVNTFSYAQSLVSSNVLQAGELVRCYEDDVLYIVTDNGLSLASVGVGSQTVQEALNTLYLNGNAYSKFLKIDYPTTISGNVSLSSLSVGPANVTTVTPNTVITAGDKATTFSNVSNSYAFMTVGGVLSANSYVESRLSASGANVMLDLSKASKFVVNATSNINLSFSNVASNNDVAIVSILYHSTGYFYLNWPVGIKWPNGNEPFHPIAGNVGSYTLISTNNGNVWYGMLTSNTYI